MLQLSPLWVGSGPSLAATSAGAVGQHSTAQSIVDASVKCQLSGRAVLGCQARAHKPCLDLEGLLDVIAHDQDPAAFKSNLETPVHTPHR